ncbi:hypothetical protein V7139_09550 [Neobacillus drentensis]|uniref:hypothetical protein n=1 Tax=Neobacillus drentensis TaxID=220684 RepID=UPI003001F39F
MSTKNVNVDELRAQIEAELRAKIEAESNAKLEKEASLRKELEEKLKNNEANLEAKIAKEEKNLKKQLDAMPKVSIEIPEDPNNPDDVVPVGWNGIIYAIPRGQQFEVPKVIYEIWRESHKKTQEVNKRIRESVNKEITVL